MKRILVAATAAGIAGIVMYFTTSFAMTDAPSVHQFICAHQMQVIA